MKNYLKLFSKVIIVILVFCVAAYLLLTLAYCIPTQGSLHDNFITSIQQLSEHKENERLSAFGNSQLDNLTDSLMLNEAAYESQNPNPFIDSLKNMYLTSDSAKQALEDKYLNNKNENIFEVSYARYWHGYLIFLKPLLFFLDLFTIKHIFMSIQILLVFLIVRKLMIEQKKFLALGFILTWLFLNPITVMLCLEYYFCIIIMMISVLIVLYFKKTRYKTICVIFTIIGCATSYFDFFTAPIITLGIPCTIWVSFNKENSLKSYFKKIILLSICWALGFCITWAIKWILASVITGQNVIEDAFQNISLRTGSKLYFDFIVDSNNRIIMYFATIGLMLFYSINPIFYMCAVVVLVLLIKKIKVEKLNKNMLFTYLVIFLLPFIYTIFVVNHTCQHAHFTYRILAVSAFAFFAYCSTYFDKNKISIVNQKNMHI